jgi:hypothetical protein
MKYCYTCKTSRPDGFKFCTRCGSSFDVKYCRNIHPNPVDAVYCQLCGSSDLSVPHRRPRTRTSWVVVLLIMSISTVGTVVSMALAPLAQLGIATTWEIVTVMAIITLAVVIWTSIKNGL